MSAPRRFDLICFDWDGTLMDSEARILACMLGAVADLGLEVPNDDAIRNIIGLGLKEAVRGLFPDADDAGRNGFKRLAENLERRGLENKTIDLFPDRFDGYDLVTGILNLVDSLGGLVPVLTAVVGIWTAFNLELLQTQLCPDMSR